MTSALGQPLSELQSDIPIQDSPGDVRRVDPAIYDEAESNESLTHLDNDLVEIEMLLDGVSCGACSWKIESTIRTLHGVQSIWVNFAARRLTVQWHQQKIRLSDIVRRIQELGYDATPWHPSEARKKTELDRKDGLKRFGIAGVFGMQVMVLAVALYFGRYSGMQFEIKQFISIAGLILTLPVILYSARPFYQNAWRGIRRLRFEMDLTVALAITLAFIGSAYSIYIGRGETYFESICMFVFLLTGARLIETTIRHRANLTVDHLANSAPEHAQKVSTPGDPGSITVSARSLKPGDIILVSSGDTIPADAVVRRGESRVNDAQLTGEPELKRCAVGDTVLAGSVNAEQPLWLEVIRPSATSTLSRIRQLADRAQTEKPKNASITDPIAGYFILFVVIVASATGCYWIIVDPARAIPITVAVLAVACPCALSLAAPASLSAAADYLIRQHVLPTRAGVIAQLGTITDVVFDKTGTLTASDDIVLSQIFCFDELSADDCLRTAAALENTLHHPLALAISKSAGMNTITDLKSLKVAPGYGVSGVIDDDEWHLGSREFVERWTNLDTPINVLKSDEEPRCWLVRGKQLIAGFRFDEKLHPHCQDALRDLVSLGINIHLVSGDQTDNVNRVAKTLQIQHVESEATPDRKYEYIQNLQTEGRRVAMIGDGINDSPALGLADVSIAVSGASPLAAIKADVVLLGKSLNSIPRTFRLAKRTRRITHQNLMWALLYNISAIPLAAMGYVPAWLAAVGMSVSSTAVVTNALRLRYREKRVRG